MWIGIVRIRLTILMRIQILTQVLNMLENLKEKKSYFYKSALFFFLVSVMGFIVLKCLNSLLKCSVLKCRLAILLVESDTDQDPAK